MALLLALGGCGGQDEAEPTRRRCLLILTLDTTRADALGCYGGPAGDTPNLDGLARRGVRLTEASTVAPITLPSHASMFTGRYPHELGVRDNRGFRLRSEEVTLAEILLDRGWATGAVIGSRVLASDSGIDQGFEDFDDVPHHSLGGGGFFLERSAAQVVDRGLDFVHAQGEAPWFLWLHFFDPHSPRDPPEEFRARTQLPEGEKDAQAQVRALYRAEVSSMDHEIGRLLAELTESGVDPVVVVVADHGEGLGDHGELTHGYSLYDSVLKVPWLVVHPDLPAGTTCAVPASVVDLVPTSLELLGLEVEGSSSGRSLVQALRDPANVDPALRSRPLYFETCYPYFTHRWSPLYGCRIDDRKLILGPQARLFDRSRDPAERDDLLAAAAPGPEDSDPESKAVAEERDHMERILRRFAEGLAPSARREVGAEEQAALVALGYLGTGDVEESEVLRPGAVDPSLRDPSDGEQLLQTLHRAVALHQRGETGKATTLMMGLLQQTPDDPQLLDHAGSFMSTIGRRRQAIPLLERALRMNPQMLSSRETLAECYHGVGDLRRAISLHRENLARNEQYLRSRLLLARLLIEEGEEEEALEHFEILHRDYVGDDAFRREIEVKRDLLRDR